MPLRGSRREIVLVAGALLLPIPVLAGSGLTLPLPDAVERGIASLSPAATGSGQVAPERPSSDVAAETDDPTIRESAVETPVAVSDIARIPAQGDVSSPLRGQNLSAGTGRSFGVVGSPGGGETPTTGEATTTGTAPDGNPSPEPGEAGNKPTSHEQGKPPLLRLSGTGQGMSTGASADESGNAVLSPPAEGEGPTGVDAGVSPDGETGVTTGGPIPDLGPTLP